MAAKIERQTLRSNGAARPKRSPAPAATPQPRAAASPQKPTARSNGTSNGRSGDGNAPTGGQFKSGRAAAATTPAAEPRVTSSAQRTLQLESDGLADLAKALGGPLSAPFARAVATLSAAKGRVIVTGIGKSGHIGQKIAATFSSTGTTAFFVHPSEASHGDLGMISRDDAILALSWSGETVELGSILTYSRRFAVPLIALTSRAESALAKAADVVLELPKAPEACPHGLAPTTSTTMTLALGDCLAIALLEAKGFTAEDFKLIHPGGSLGAQLKYVEDVMHDASDLPLANLDTPMTEAIVTMTRKAFGCLGVVDHGGKLAGIITDGDLRRHMGADLLAATTADIMTRKPKTIAPTLLASAALEQLNTARITALFVVKRGKPVGILHIHDLLRAGLG